MAPVRPIRVLLVEDEMLVVMSLRLALGSGDRFVVTGHAAGMAVALRCVERDKPDIALVDIRLAKGESGLDVARILQRHGIPSLLMSGNPPDVPLPDVAVGCLAKPFGDDDLCAALSIVASPLCGTAVSAYIPAGLKLY